MNEPRPHRTPFVLGVPIKDPGDFYGRQDVLRECFQAAQNGQYVAVVGEHRCGNTSVLYQLVHEAQRAKYLTPDEDARLVFAFVSSQLGSEDPAAFLRRVARGLRRADPEAGADFDADVDQKWLEDYLETLHGRGRHLTLLLDEFEVLAHFDPAFWEWFQVLTTEYDVSIIASTRVDLGEFRTQSGGPPMYNMFRSIYIGSFTRETVDEFLRDRTELTDFDFASVRADLDDLAGRFPFYLQSAAALFYVHAAGESHVTPTQIEEVRRDFRLRTQALFEDAWAKLPQTERDALTWTVLGAAPACRDETRHTHALRSLERRGYVVDGRVFSSALTDFILMNLRPLGVSCSPGKARVRRELVSLEAHEMLLLGYLLDHPGRVVTDHEIAYNVFPEMGAEPSSAGVEQIWRTVQRIKTLVDDPDGYQHLEILPDEGYRLRNPTHAERPWVP
jgi:DNA-binding winged helix-turn-helix (wHTH) protein